MKFYEARPGLWLVEGVSIEEHERAMASNYTPEEHDWFEYERSLAAHRQDATRIWRTRDGQRIPYSELKDSHLDNILAMLKRNGYQVTADWPNLVRERKRRDR